MPLITTMNFSSAFASPLSLTSDIKSEFSPTISREEFNSFHSIDRHLYALLVQTLGQLPPVSLQVIGFWRFLEHEECKSSPGLVKTILNWPVNSIKGLFNESVYCLKDMHPSNIEKSDDEKLKFHSELLKRSVSKMDFVANGRTILSGVQVEVSRIHRAFQDIPSRRELISPNFSLSNENPYTKLGNGAWVLVPRKTHFIEHPQNGTGVFVPRFSTRKASSSNVVSNPPQHNHSQVVGDLRKRESGKMVEEKQQEEVMATDSDRTIFLTFPRKAPVTVSEVRDFFTRLFGDFIESIEMQVVENGKKPFFVKIVSKSVEMKNVIVYGGKARYYINKKIVCAKKFL